MTNKKKYPNMDSAWNAFLKEECIPYHNVYSVKTDDFVSWLDRENIKKLTVNEIKEKLVKLKWFLDYRIGVGDHYGSLGHDAGGVLSHQVLCNDSHCYSTDENGKIIETSLNKKDYKEIESVYNDLKDIIEEGRKNEFVCLIDNLINFFDCNNISDKQFSY